MKKLTLFLILSFILSIFDFQFSTIFAQSTKPILRLNTQMYTAKIGRISTDAKGKYILTVSADKTAKLWSAKTGGLLKTFRPPIGHGKEGMLYSGAISPNGKIVAVAGRTAYDWDRSCSIYIFNNSTGELIQRLSGLGNVIFDLEFSQNGTYLAAALGSTKGVIIYKQNFDKGSNFVKLRTLTGYGGSSFNIAFSPNGKLVVAYYDTPIVEIFSAQNLKFLYNAKLDGMNKNGGLNKLCFSKDGKYLYGGGKYAKYINGKCWFVIRKWENAGQGKYIDYPACNNSIMDMKMLLNGNIIFAGGQPDFWKNK